MQRLAAPDADERRLADDQRPVRCERPRRADAVDDHGGGRGCRDGDERARRAGDSRPDQDRHEQDRHDVEVHGERERRCRGNEREGAAGADRMEEGHAEKAQCQRQERRIPERRVADRQQRCREPQGPGESVRRATQRAGGDRDERGRQGEGETCDLLERAQAEPEQLAELEHVRPEGALGPSAEAAPRPGSTHAPQHAVAGDQEVPRGVEVERRVDSDHADENPCRGEERDRSSKAARAERLGPPALGLHGNGHRTQAAQPRQAGAGASLLAVHTFRWTSTRD